MADAIMMGSRLGMTTRGKVSAANGSKQLKAFRAAATVATRSMGATRRSGMALSTRMQAGSGSSERETTPLSMDQDDEYLGLEEDEQAGWVPNRRDMISTAAGAFLACGCPAGPAQAKASWGYGEMDGYRSWAGVCPTGQEQSPIDIPGILQEGVAKEGAGVFSMKWGKQPELVINTGHGTMQVNYPAGECITTLEGKKFELLQWHAHSPSEHTFDGYHSAMEVHLVHRDVKTGGLAVLGVMLEAAAKVPENRSLKTALECAPIKPFGRNESPPPIDPALFLPPKTTYIHYDGSLTTPPCSEGVAWFLMNKPIKVPPAQVLAFTAYLTLGKSYGQNNRPVQPLAGRSLETGGAADA